MGGNLLSHFNSDYIFFLDIFIHINVNIFFLPRYVCGPEAAHRIFGFDIHHRSISVERLPFHLPDSKYISFNEDEDLESVRTRAKVRQSKLEAFFTLCQNDERARNLTYQQVPEHYVWDGQGCFWKVRKQGEHYGRLNTTHHAAGEMWYLRMLLCRVKGPTSFKDLRKVNNYTHATFEDTCRVLGLLKDDNEWHEAISENEHTALPHQLRRLFVHIIVNCDVGDVYKLWDSHWVALSDDVLYNLRKQTGNSDLTMANDDIKFYALAGMFIYLFT